MASERQARIALTVVFAATGIFTGTWFAHIPNVQAAFHLSYGKLGLILACSTIGAVTASPVAAVLSARFGSRRLLRVSAPAVALSWLFVALAPTVPVLIAALFTMGFTNALVQVSMNAQAVALEHRYRRTILSSMHGGFSVGMLAGAMIAALVDWIGISYRAHLETVAAALFVVSIALGFFLLDAERTARVKRRRAPLSLALVLLVFAAFFELFCEGSATTWSAKYMDKLGASSALGAFTFGVYALMMTAGRLRGDSFVSRLGVGRLVRYGALLAAGGVVLTLAAPNLAVALTGFAVLGLGLSCLAPTLFRAAGQLPLPEGQGIATVLGAAWPAFLLVGPLIGLISSATSLRTALVVPLVSALIVAALAGWVGRTAPAPTGFVGQEPSA
jgi:MFS family permease